MSIQHNERGKSITSYSAEEIKDLPSQTDTARLDSMTDEELEANALSDPDNPPLPEDFFQRAKQMRLEDFMRKAKGKISLRLDQEVLSFFKATGPGYQTRINAVLKGYVSQVRKTSPSQKG